MYMYIRTYNHIRSYIYDDYYGDIMHELRFKIYLCGCAQ